MSSIKVSNIIAAVIIVLALIAAALSWLLPIPASWSGSDWAFRAPTALSAFFCVMYIGSSILLLRGAYAYKAKLRRAYLLIVLSVILLALSFVQAVFLNAYGLIYSAWVSSGAALVPLLLTAAFAYLGTRSMAKLVGVHLYLTRLYIVIPLVIVVILASTILPNTIKPQSEYYFDFGNAIMVWCGVVYGIAGLLVLRIRKHMGNFYSQPMLWLAVALLSTTVNGFTAAVMTLTNPSSEELSFEILTALSSMLFLKAGHAFALTKRYEEPLLGSLLGSQSAPTTSVIDMVTETAGLASNPQEIDPILDKMRATTARLGSATQLSPSDEHALFDVYLNIEEYLTTKDPIRTFSKDELRKKFSPGLLAQLKTYEDKEKGMV